MTFWSRLTLAAMCFVRDANDIAAFRKEFGVFGEFMDRCQEDTATIASRQLITQIFTAGNGKDGVVTNVIFWRCTFAQKADRPDRCGR